MFIPFLKNNENLPLAEKVISEKVLTYLHKKNLENSLGKIKDILNQNLNSIFSFEIDDISNFKKIYGLNSNEGILLFAVTYSGAFYFYHFRKYGFLTTEYRKNNDFISSSELRDFVSSIVDNEIMVGLSPYKLNEKVTSSIKYFFRNASSTFNSKMSNIDPHLSYRYGTLFTKESKYIISYFKNKLFSYVDKKVFKDLYSYYLHYSDTQIYNNIISSSDNVVNNFYRLKKEHNFLSMALVDTKFALFTLILSNYDMVLNNIAKKLSVDLSLIEPLKGKSYNDFLYIKTPQKYFNILKKYNLKIDKPLNLKQVKFLNNIIYRNSTFIKPHDIEVILYNDELLNKFEKMFKMRKCFNISHFSKDYYEDINSYIESTTNEFNENLNNCMKQKNFSTINEKYTHIDEDGKKILLTSLKQEDLFVSIKNHVFNNEKSFSNIQYWPEILRVVKSIYIKNTCYLFNLKENRQNHAVILIISKDSISYYSETLTPRVSKKLQKMMKDESFISYIFDFCLFKKPEKKIN